MVINIDYFDVLKRVKMHISKHRKLFSRPDIFLHISDVTWRLQSHSSMLDVFRDLDHVDEFNGVNTRRVATYDLSLLFKRRSYLVILLTTLTNEKRSPEIDRLKKQIDVEIVILTNAMRYVRRKLVSVKRLS